MTPAELQQLLITRAPDVPGITAAARRDDENPYGLTVTLQGGGRAWWTITGASPAGAAPGSGPPGEDPVPVPDLTGRPVPVAAVEQALIATAVARAGGQISSIDRYSTHPDRRPSATAPPSHSATAGSSSCPATAPPAPASHAPTTPTAPPATSSLPSPTFLVRLPVEPGGYSSPALSSARTPAASGRT
jgi:hypothetical protein